MNNRTDTKAQPGRANGCAIHRLDCADVAVAARCDGVTDICVASTDYYVVALVIWPGVDYHWYHLYPEGFWGHKRGETIARNYDEDGKIIQDPQYCNRGPYIDWCGYWVAPVYNVII